MPRHPLFWIAFGTVGLSAAVYTAFVAAGSPRPALLWFAALSFALSGINAAVQVRRFFRRG